MILMGERGDLIGMGSLDHKNFAALHPQFWRARNANGYGVAIDPV